MPLVRIDAISWNDSAGFHFRFGVCLKPLAQISFAFVSRLSNRRVERQATRSRDSRIPHGTTAARSEITGSTERAISEGLVDERMLPFDCLSRGATWL
jgi:hypothetical protein